MIRLPLQNYDLKILGDFYRHQLIFFNKPKNPKSKTNTRYTISEGVEAFLFCLITLKDKNQISNDTYEALKESLFVKMDINLRHIISSNRELLILLEKYLRDCLKYIFRNELDDKLESLTLGEMLHYDATYICWPKPNQDSSIRPICENIVDLRNEYLHYKRDQSLNTYNDLLYDHFNIWKAYFLLSIYISFEFCKIQIEESNGILIEKNNEDSGAIFCRFIQSKPYLIPSRIYNNTYEENIASIQPLFGFIRKNSPSYETHIFPYFDKLDNYSRFKETIENRNGSYLFNHIIPVVHTNINAHNKSEIHIRNKMDPQFSLPFMEIISVKEDKQERITIKNERERSIDYLIQGKILFSYYIENTLEQVLHTENKQLISNLLKNQLIDNNFQFNQPSNSSRTAQLIADYINVHKNLKPVEISKLDSFPETAKFLENIDQHLDIEVVWEMMLDTILNHTTHPLLINILSNVHGDNHLIFTLTQRLIRHSIYKTGLSHRQFSKYLELMHETGNGEYLIRLVDSTHEDLFLYDDEFENCMVREVGPGIYLPINSVSGPLIERLDIYAKFIKSHYFLSTTLYQALQERSFTQFISVRSQLDRLKYHFKDYGSNSYILIDKRQYIPIPIKIAKFIDWMFKGSDQKKLIKIYSRHKSELFNNNPLQNIILAHLQQIISKENLEDFHNLLKQNSPFKYDYASSIPSCSVKATKYRQIFNFQNITDLNIAISFIDNADSLAMNTGEHFILVVDSDSHFDWHLNIKPMFTYKIYIFENQEDGSSFIKEEKQDLIQDYINLLSDKEYFESQEEITPEITEQISSTLGELRNYGLSLPHPRFRNSWLTTGKNKYYSRYHGYTNLPSLSLFKVSHEEKTGQRQFHYLEKALDDVRLLQKLKESHLFDRLIIVGKPENDDGYAFGIPLNRSLMSKGKDTFVVGADLEIGDRVDVLYIDNPNRQTQRSCLTINKAGNYLQKARYIRTTKETESSTTIEIALLHGGRKLQTYLSVARHYQIETLQEKTIGLLTRIEDPFNVSVVL